MDKKYSTGTKGRIQKHADLCKNAIKEHCKDNALATEYFKEVDPNYDNNFWQTYTTIDDALIDFRKWLGEDDVPKAAPTTEEVISELKTKIQGIQKKEKHFNKSTIDANITEMQQWVDSEEASNLFNGLTSKDIAAIVIERFRLYFD